MKKVREENIPLINYVLEVKDGDVSDNQDVQRYFCSDDAFINGIGVTILTGDYLPPLILAEVPINDEVVQKYVVDGLQRTTALMKIRYMNYKFSGTMEDNIIEYQAKKVDDNGVLLKDGDGNFVWEKKTYDIKGKTYDDFPKELKKKFDNYQLRIATYQNCTMEMVSKLVRKLNNHKGMNTSQQALTWIPTYARKIKNIAESRFFKDSIEYSDSKRKNGEYIQMVCRSVMDVFHFDKYKRGSKDLSNFLEENSSIEEFNIIQSYFSRLEKLSGDKFKALYVNKDIPIWLTVFDKFAKTGMDDAKFAEFLDALITSLHSKKINGDSYDSLYKETGTTNKKLVNRKIELYTALMNEYLHIEDSNGETENELRLDNVLGFIRENIKLDTNKDDIELYENMVDDCVKIDSLLYKNCSVALICLMSYACNIEKDKEFEKWANECNIKSFSTNQKNNYIKIKDSFDKYIA